MMMLLNGVVFLLIGFGLLRFARMYPDRSDVGISRGSVTSVWPLE